jgi:OFA family oxalate/formate antiporter-like MFS transporter
MTATGSWLAVFVIGASMNILSAVLALFVLKPMRVAYTRRAAAADMASAAALPGRAAA